MEQHGDRAPYSCRLIEDPTALHREHIVPWQQIRDDSPSCQIAQSRYQAGINLTVAFADVNLEKGSKDIAEWQPAHNVCWFAERIQQVKERWALSYRASEQRTLRGILANCSAFERSNLICREDSEELLEQMQRPTRWRWLYQRGAAGDDARPQREAAAP